mgnify:CR=1 FL=1
MGESINLSSQSKRYAPEYRCNEASRTNDRPLHCDNHHLSCKLVELVLNSHVAKRVPEPTPPMTKALTALIVGNSLAVAIVDDDYDVDDDDTSSHNCWQ